MDVSTEPTSLYMIRAAELFPKPSVEKEEENLEVPLIERKIFPWETKRKSLIILIFQFPERVSSIWDAQKMDCWP